MTDYYKVSVLLFLVVLIVSCGPGEEHSEEAERILNKVSERYGNLETFEFEGELASQVIAGNQDQNRKFNIYFARKEPGSMRLEVSGNTFEMTLVSDGSTTWTYVPSLGEYTRRESALFQTSGDRQTGIGSSSDFTGMGEQLTKSYETINRGMKKARLLGEEIVTLENGTKYEAYKIEVEYEKDPGMNNVMISPTNYLIEKNSSIVLRQDVQISTSAGSPNGQMTMLQTVRLINFSLSPEFNNAQFSFAPPEQAKEVGELSLDGMESKTQNELVGEKAPDFKLESFAGDSVSLQSLGGNVVILDFWATWCGPCREAHPHLQKLHEELQDEGLIVLGINSEDDQTVEGYMDHNNYTFTNLVDLNQSVASRYNITTIPSVYIIDREGRVSSHLLGYQPESRLRKAIEKAGL